MCFPDAPWVKTPYSKVNGDVMALVVISLWSRHQMSGLLQFAVRQGAETESFMTSAERVAEYGGVPTESTPEPHTAVKPEWPDRGVVEVCADP